MTSFKRRSRAIHVDKLSEQAVRVSLRATIYSRHVHVRVTQIHGGIWSVRPDGDWPLHEWTFITDPRLYGDLMYLMAVYGLELAMQPGTVHSIRMDKRYRECYTLADGIPYDNTAPALTSGWTYYGLRHKTFNEGTQQLHGYIDRLMRVIEDEHRTPEPTSDKSSFPPPYIAIDSWAHTQATVKPVIDVGQMRALLTRFDLPGGTVPVCEEFGCVVRSEFDYDRCNPVLELHMAEPRLQAVIDRVVKHYAGHGVEIARYLSWGITVSGNDITMSITPNHLTLHERMFSHDASIN